MKIKNNFYPFLAAILALMPLRAAGQEVYGNPADPMTAKVLGTEVHTTDLDELRYVVLARLVDRYATGHNIEVSRKEIDAYVNGLRRMAENEHKRNQARRQELTRKLASQGLTKTERESLSSQLEPLNELIATLKEGEDASTQNFGPGKEYREQVAAVFIRQWKINRALYGQYAGRVIFQQGGPEPLDACRRFLEEQQALGAFTILDKALSEKFWGYYVNDAIHSFYPPGSEEEAKAFETPWWLQETPQE
jgi:hypothetical protein